MHLAVPAPVCPPCRPRRGRAWLVVLLALAGAPATSACGPDPEGACGSAYAHLLTLGRRTHSADLRARFIKACVEAWDRDKVACIERAANAEAAMACEWIKKRPG